MINRAEAYKRGLVPIAEQHHGNALPKAWCEFEVLRLKSRGVKAALVKHERKYIGRQRKIMYEVWRDADYLMHLHINTDDREIANRLPEGFMDHEIYKDAYMAARRSIIRRREKAHRQAVVNSQRARFYFQGED